MRALTCGVLVTDGASLLIGHATGSPRWDIPKGLAESGEMPEETARRELEEETGLSPATSLLRPLGHFAYLPKKDLALFTWTVAAMPDSSDLVCRSVFERNGRSYPEFDRFAVLSWHVAVPKLGSSMQRVVRAVMAEQGWGDPPP